MTRTRVAAGLVAVAVAALLWWPLRDGVPYLDDWLFLALAAHLQEPQLLFLQDAVGAFFFRPIGLLAWWISERIMGSSASAQYAFNMLLQAGCGAAVAVLARTFGLRRAVACAAGLLFAVHPAPAATAMWLSDRFDLLATGFGLLALAATDRSMRRFTVASSLGACALLMLSIGGKEMGYAVAATAAAMVLLPGSDTTATVRQRALLLAGLVACTLVTLGARYAFLRSGAESMFLQDGVLATVGGALVKATLLLPQTLVVPYGNELAVATWAVSLGVLACAFLLLRAWRQLRAHSRPVIVGLGLALIALIAEAPILNATPTPPFDPSGFQFGALAAMRFFHLPVAGLALAAAAIAEAVAQADERPTWPWRPALALVMTIALVATSYAIGGGYMDARGRARTEAGMAQAAVAALNAAGPMERPCKLYFLGTAESGFGFRNYADVAVKALLPRGHPATRCFILSEEAPWYNVLADAPPAIAERAPLESMSFGGRPYPPLVLGNLTYYYVDIPNTAAVRDDPSARFFEWREGRFVEITDALRRGAREVTFVKTRPPA